MVLVRVVETFWLQPLQDRQGQEINVIHTLQEMYKLDEMAVSESEGTVGCARGSVSSNRSMSASFKFGWPARSAQQALICGVVS